MQARFYAGATSCAKGFQKPTDNRNQRAFGEFLQAEAKEVRPMKQLRDWIQQAKNIVFFGGAGVSTEIVP